MDEADRTPTESRGFTPAAPPSPPEPEPDFSAILEELRALMPPQELLDAEQREDESMHRNYPGEHVAYRDTWNPPVFRREIVAHSPKSDAVYAALDQFPEAERREIVLTYCESAEEARAFRIGYCVGTIRSGTDSTDSFPPRDRP